MLPETLAAGTIIQGTYELVRCIGAGGMGTVYEAKHARLSGRYAVKFLLPEVASHEEAFARFRREAEVTSSLRHPNIVQVVDFDRMPDSTPYLVMEMLEGRELTEVLRAEAPLAPARAADLVQQIASALDAAHRRNIVHRDLKPQNLFLVKVPGRPDLIKVMDFGISKVREATTRLTRDHAVMGTPQYMSPEQALGRVDEIDGRTDQFALATIAYEMLTGRPAFRGDSVQSVLFQVVQTQPEALDAVLPGLGPQLAAVVSRGLSKRREDRFPTILEMAESLADAAARASGARAGGARVGDTPPPTRSAAKPSGTLSYNGEAGAAVDEMIAPPVRQGARARRSVVVLAMAALAAAALVIVMRVRRDAAPPAEAIAGATRSAPPGEAPAPALPPPSAPAAATVTAAAPARASEAAAAHAVVHIGVYEPVPPGLQITVDGVLGDLPVEIPRGPALHDLRFDAPGYDTFAVRVDGTQDRKILLPMRKLGAGKRVSTKRDDVSGRAAPSAAPAPKPSSSPAATPSAPAPAPARPQSRIITDF